MKVLDYGAERKWQGLSALSVPLLPKPLARRLSHPGLISTAKNSTLQAFSVNWPVFCIKYIYRYYHIKIFL